MLRRRFWLLLLGLSVGASASVAACGGKGSGTGAGTTTGTTSGTGGTGGGVTGLGGSFLGGDGGNQVLDVEPSTLQTISVTAGQTMPTISYTATVNGAPASVAWSIDQGAVATITPGQGTGATFAPTGTTGGLVNVIATLNNMTVQRPVFIKLTMPSQSGPTAAESGQVATMTSQLTAGGGVGGVGGEGLGPAVTNFPTTTMPAAMGLKFLYPYDKTVWPRGMLAPLLMWDWTPEDADAIQISLQTTSGSFSWSGTFGRPALLGQGGAPTGFIRSPIPHDVWTTATNTAGGTTPNNMPDQLTVSLVVAKGGVAYGPITETWTVAPGRLAGTVYYNSYGTGLVQNSTDTDFDNNEYGAAVLAIQGGATGPVVVAGTQSPLPTGAGCRVCHVVSGDGSRLIAQHGDNYATTSSYDLKNGNAETVLTGYDSTFGWAGLYIDGSTAFTNLAQLAAGQPAASQMFSFPPTSSTPLTATGIPSDLQAGAPAFSPDGKHVSFELLGGSLGMYTGTFTGMSQLVALDFDQATMAFSNPRLLATMPGGGTTSVGGLNAGFPAFFPTNDAVVFHNQLSNPNAGHRYNTWQGATAQVWWSDLGTGTATPLAVLNGFDLASKTSYLPTSSSHPDDTTLNYEPTTAPVVSGGYAWVVFTTRRLYGNLATIAPTISDPRTTNYHYKDYAEVTCKKLWVAAVDIGSIQNGTFVEGVPPGTDPSHPAFYLPGQELQAGNSRGFWVLDPCKADGTSCSTGDQCCNGFCEPGDGGLVCGMPTSGCAGIQDKCTTAADCCDPSALCINGFCAMAQTQ